MIFLIEYCRDDRRIVTLSRFSNDERGKADEARLDLELELNRLGQDREVVLLEAPDEASLHRTHGRYFKNLLDLVDTSATASR